MEAQGSWWRWEERAESTVKQKLRALCWALPGEGRETSLLFHSATALRPQSSLNLSDV